MEIFPGFVAIFGSMTPENMLVMLSLYLYGDHLVHRTFFEIHLSQITRDYNRKIEQS